MRWGLQEIPNVLSSPHCAQSAAYGLLSITAGRRLGSQSVAGEIKSHFTLENRKVDLVVVVVVVVAASRHVTCLIKAGLNARSLARQLMVILTQLHNRNTRRTKKGEGQVAALPQNTSPSRVPTFIEMIFKKGRWKTEGRLLVFFLSTREMRRWEG